MQAFQPRSYWIPGSWDLRIVYTDDEVVTGKKPKRRSLLLLRVCPQIKYLIFIELQSISSS